MSYNSGLIACNRLQEKLNDRFEADIKKRDQTPFTEYLLSGENRGDLQMGIGGRGHYRTVELVYQPRKTRSDVSANATFPVCTASAPIDEYSETYQIDIAVNEVVSMSVTETQLAAKCADNEAWFTEQLEDMVNALVMKVNAKSSTQASSLLGGWDSAVASIPDVSVNGSDELVVRTRMAASGVSGYEPYPYTHENISSAARLSNIERGRIFSGLSLESNFRQLVAAAGLADYGIDLSRIVDAFGIPVQFDRDIATAQSSQAKGWLVGEGALQMIYFNHFGDPFNELTDDSYRQGVITDPLTGLPIDITVKRDCGNIAVNMAATTKVVGLPTDMYKSTDHLSGVNGFAAIAVDNS